MCCARNATSDLGITNRVKIDFEGSTHQGFITTHVINPWCSTCLTENELEEGSKCWFMFKHRVRRNTSSRCFHFCFIRASLKKGFAFHRIRVDLQMRSKSSDKTSIVEFHAGNQHPNKFVILQLRSGSSDSTSIVEIWRSYDTKRSLPNPAAR